MPPTIIITTICQVRCSGACRSWSNWLRSMPASLEGEQHVAVGNGLAGCRLDTGDNAVAWRANRAFHLHCLERAQLLTEIDRVAGLDRDVQDVAGHGRFDLH